MAPVGVVDEVGYTWMLWAESGKKVVMDTSRKIRGLWTKGERDTDKAKPTHTHHTGKAPCLQLLWVLRIKEDRKDKKES
jgi:hypothetical protein